MAEQQSAARPIRVLDNQPVRTPPFADHVTFLYNALPRWLGALVRKAPQRGIVEGIVMFVAARRFDATITVGTGGSFAFGLLNRIFGRPRRQVAKELYFDENSLGSPFRRRLVRWALGGVDRIVTNSRGEIPHLSGLLNLPEDRLEFAPWPAELPSPDEPTPRGDYIFAGGRSFRDWPTLFAAVAGAGMRTIVVASAGDVSGLPAPPEVELILDIPYERYLEILRGARVVVTPLKPTFRSVGQVAMLEAMALGKPLVAANVTGVLDYIEDGVNGLVYEPGNAAQLRGILLRLAADEVLQDRLGRGALRRVKERFNNPAYSRAMLGLMERVCGAAESAG